MRTPDKLRLRNPNSVRRGSTETGTRSGPSVTETRRGVPQRTEPFLCGPNWIKVQSQSLGQFRLTHHTHDPRRDHSQVFYQYPTLTLHQDEMVRNGRSPPVPYVSTGTISSRPSVPSYVFPRPEVPLPVPLDVSTLWDTTGGTSTIRKQSVVSTRILLLGSPLVWSSTLRRDPSPLRETPIDRIVPHHHS